MERAFGLEIPQTLAEACDPRRMALIVYDMQVGILQQITERTRIITAVQAVLEATRAAGVRIVFTRHMSLPKELAGVFQLRQAMAWQRVTSAAAVHPWFLRDTPGFALIPELAPRPSEAIFDKITFSAFEGTPLDIALRDCGITTIAIVGVATEVGIEPTVRHSTDLGYIPIVISDACGAGNAEAAERSIASLRYMGDALLTTVAEFRTLLEGHRSAAPSPA